MMNFGPIKMLFTAVAALLILGPKRLPEAVRNLGKALTQLRKASREVTQELKSEMAAEETHSHGGPPAHTSPRAAATGTAAALPVRSVDPPASATTGPRPLPPPEELRPGPR